MQRSKAYFPHYHWIATLLFAIGAGGINSVDAQMSSYIDEIGQRIKNAGEFTALGSDLFGDSVNWYDGQVNIRIVDVDIPGNNELAVQFVRTLSSSPSRNVTRFMAAWSLEFPYISAVYAQTAPWREDRCSGPQAAAQVPPPTVPNHPDPIDPTAVSSFASYEYWDGNSIHIPGYGKKQILWRDSTYSEAPTTVTEYPWVTNDHIQIACLSTLASGQPGEGFMAITPTGVRYYFDWLVETPYYELGRPNPYASETGIDPLFYFIKRDHFRIFPSRVEDRHGNYVEYTYVDGRPIKIESSDGREISISYNGEGRVYAVEAQGRIWEYHYSPYLSSVTLPDETSWQYTEEVRGRSVLFISHLASSHSSCSALTGQMHSGPVSWTMTHPGGATAVFELEPKRHFRSGTPSEFCGDPIYYIGPNVISDYWQYSLIQKTISGPSLSATTWSADFSPTIAVEKIVTLTNPDLSTVEYTYGTEYYRNEGKVLRKKVRDWNNVLLQEESYHYAIEPSSPPYAYRVGSNGRLGEDDFDSVLQVPIVAQTVWRDGVTYSESVEIEDFDEFAMPTKINFSNTLGFSKDDLISYYHDYGKWVVSQLESRIDVATGLVEKQADYDSSNARPWRTYSFGLLKEIAVYNPDGTLSSVEDGMGRATNFSNWKRGLPQLVVFPELTTISSTVNDRGWVTSVTDENFNQTAYEYDVMGRLSTIEHPVGDAVNWQNAEIEHSQIPSAVLGIPATSWHRQEVVGNYRKRTFYDARRQPILEEEVDVGALTAVYRRSHYDHEGRVSFESYPAGSLSSANSEGVYYSYDALGRLTKKSTHDNIVLEEIEYLTANRKRVTDADGRVTTVTYQALGQPDRGRPILIESSEGQTTTIIRDIFGKITAVTQSGDWGGGVVSATRSFSYDDHQRLCRRTDPESGSTVWGHNSASEIVWEAKGQSGSGCLTTAPSGATLFEYDLRGRKVLDDYPGTDEDVSYAYDAVGNLTSVSNATATWNYTYNKRNLRETEQAVLDSKVFLLASSYDALGHINSLTTPSGHTISYTPDVWGRPTQLGSYVSDIEYHPNGLVSGYVLGNGLNYSQSLNTRQWPAQQQTLDGSTLVQGLAYDYSHGGNLTTITDLVDGSDSVTLSYDDLHRLETAAGLWGTYTYAYDPLNNIRSRTHGGGTADLSYSYNAANNRLTAIGGSQTRTYAYNARGEITGDGTQTFTLNSLGQIQSITGVSVYGYDGNGRRIRTVKDGTTEYALYDRSGRLVHREKGATQTDYLSLNGKAIAELNTVGSTTTPTYLHPDLLGSPRRATSTSGAVLWQEHYDPYGQKLNGSPGRIGYTGHVHDEESGYTYMQARFYDSLVGRFLSTDPVHFIDDNPFAFNRYAYANNNPYKYKDPDGRLPIFIPMAIGMGLGGISSFTVQMIAAKGDVSRVSWGQVGVTAAAGGLGGLSGVISAQASTAGRSIAAQAFAGASIGATSTVASNTVAGINTTTRDVALGAAVNMLAAGSGARVTNIGRASDEAMTGIQRVAQNNLRDSFRTATESSGGRFDYGSTMSSMTNIGGQVLSNIPNLIPPPPPPMDEIIND